MIWHVLLFILYFLTLLISLHIGKKMHGGPFTSVLPFFISAVGILAAKHFFELIFVLFSFQVEKDLDSLRFSTQALQLVAGIMLMTALYHFYHMGHIFSEWKKVR
ncbi:MAG: hypothetical protein QXW70_00755 [Candidatus Anstonellales archaeon]